MREGRQLEKLRCCLKTFLSLREPRAHQKGWTDRELKTHLEHFMDWTQAKGQKYVDWDAALRSHIRRNMEKVKQSGKKPKTIGGVYAS